MKEHITRYVRVSFFYCKVVVVCENFERKNQWSCTDVVAVRQCNAVLMADVNNLARRLSQEEERPE